MSFDTHTLSAGPDLPTRRSERPWARQLDPGMLQSLLDLSEHFSFRISEIAGASHSRRSTHYDGQAFDVDMIEGQAVNAANPYYRDFMEVARDLGATVLIGPGDPKHPDHSTHVHVTMPRTPRREIVPDRPRVGAMSVHEPTVSKADANEPAAADLDSDLSTQSVGDEEANNSVAEQATETEPELGWPPWPSVIFILDGPDSGHAAHLHSGCAALANADDDFFVEILDQPVQPDDEPYGSEICADCIEVVDRQSGVYPEVGDSSWYSACQLRIWEDRLEIVRPTMLGLTRASRCFMLTDLEALTATDGNLLSKPGLSIAFPQFSCDVAFNNTVERDGALERVDELHRDAIS